MGPRSLQPQLSPLALLGLVGGFGGGDPLCVVDGRARGSCCAQGQSENLSCWAAEPGVTGPQEFHYDRCCQDRLGASGVNHGDTLPPGYILGLLSRTNLGVVLVRNIPGFSDLLHRGSDVWYDVDRWPNQTGTSTDRAPAHSHLRDVRAADEAVGAVLSRVVSWIVSALSDDLRHANAPGGDELLAVLKAAPLGHVRHFEYLLADWEGQGGWISRRWGLFFIMHSDSFWVSVQTCPSLGGTSFHDGTFIVDEHARLHRVRLGESDVAIWFGDSVQQVTAGRVRAAKHMVLVHRSYRKRLAGESPHAGPRRVTMFHMYPHSRKPENLIAAGAVQAVPRRRSRWRTWSESRKEQRALKSDLDLPADLV